MEKKFFDRIFYEIYPSSYKDANGDGMGDIKGIIERLDYIKGLGFDGVWLNPIYDSPFLDGGYDVRDFFKIDKRFGTMKDLERLIEEIHSRDMLLFLDLVPGHASSQNKEFLRSAEATPNEYSDLFIWNNSPWELEEGYRLISGMHDRSGCYMVNFFAHQPAINYGFAKITKPWQKLYTDKSLKGKEYLIKIMKFYLEKGVDGFRVDMADSLVKNEDDKVCTIALWQEVFSEVKKDYPSFLATSEWSNPERSLKAGFSSDFILDHHDNCSHMFFRQGEDGKKPLLHQFDKKLYKECIKDLKWRIKCMNENEGTLSFISGNHDSFRIADYLNDEELRLAYLLILTMPGVPFIFAGDELGQKTNRELTSKEGGYQRTGTRIPFPYDENMNRGFSSSEENLFLPIDMNTTPALKQMNDPKSLLNFIKELIKLRKDEADLRSKDIKILDSVFAYKRGKIKVIINLLDVEQSYSVNSSTVLFAIGDPQFSLMKVVLEPHEAIVIKESE